jgi:carboxyl-terminal processing protease
MSRNRWWSIGLALILISMTASMTYFSVRTSVYGDIYLYVCDLVEERFYENSPFLQNWARDCRNDVEEISSFETLDTLMSRLQIRLHRMGVSHLDVYSPVEDRRLWQGKAQENGLKVRLIDGQYVITRVYPGSVAAQVELLPGDIVDELEGEKIHSLWQITHGQGFYTIIRSHQSMTVYMEPREISLDAGPTLRSLKNKTGLLEISSFRSEYFDRESWKKMVGYFSTYSHLVVDIRGNSGGSFVAMLRALSPFFCDPKIVGYLKQPRKPSAKEIDLDDNLDDIYQLKILDKAPSIRLRTFSDYGCYQGKVTVLSNYQTASVSEIFAHAMVSRHNARVWGEATSGDVVLAVWYNLPHLRRGYSLSIPEAVVLTHDQINLEGRGVWPSRELTYSLSDAVRGEDSWVKTAEVW